MVAPVTGPFASLVETLGPPNSNGVRTTWFHHGQSWQRQKKPYNLPLPFTSDYKRITSLTATNPDASVVFDQCTSCASTTWSAYLGPASLQSWNRTHAKFVEAIKPAQAELGAAVGEMSKSLEMIANRSRQLYLTLKAIKGLRFGEAAKLLGIRKDFKPRKKQFADALLEYRFGWAPLIGDIDNAMKTLTGGLPQFKVKAAASYNNQVSWKTGGPLPGTPVYTHSMSYSSKHRITAFIGITNPNLALANQLGLLNPASVLWELTHFSFVFDYFVNVSQFLNGFTDLAGFDIIHPNWTWKPSASSVDTVTWNGGNASWVADRLEVQRSVGSIPGPILTVRAPWQLKPWRAATSIALLLQMWPRKG